jgi:predicted nucleic acid-binding protein
LANAARSARAAVLDACVLYPPTLCDTLLRLAEAGLYLPRWSDVILEELERNLAQEIGEERASHRVGQMRQAFPEAEITGYESLLSQMENDPKDRHVLAAAVASGAPVIVTDNSADFPVAALTPLGVAAQTADQFLLDLYFADPTRVRDVLERQAASYQKPPMTIEVLLDRLDRLAPELVDRIRTDPVVDAM